MAKIFFAADTHFFCENALKYRYRPFESVDEMNKTIVELWNKTVGEDDIVYHLGDFSVTNEGIEEFAPQLNGEKFLIIGNHDYNKDKVLLRKYFTICNNPFVLEFDKDLCVNEADENELWLAHYPLQRHESLYSCVGHIHSLYQIAKNMVNVGVDAWSFRPVPIEWVLASRNSEKVGHWDANVYPDAGILWQEDVTNKIQRKSDAGEPTIEIIKENKDAIVEQCSAIAHEVWSGWMEYMFDKCTEVGDGNYEIPAQLVERWQRQMKTPYQDLSDKEKESDREEANKYIEVLQK